MEDDAKQFIENLENRFGGPIEYRTYSTWFATNEGIVREFGVFVYEIEGIFHFEDFERKPSMFGFSMKPRKNQPKICEDGRHLHFRFDRKCHTGNESKCIGVCPRPQEAGRDRTRRRNPENLQPVGDPSGYQERSHLFLRTHKPQGIFSSSQGGLAWAHSKRMISEVYTIRILTRRITVYIGRGSFFLPCLIPTTIVVGRDCAHDQRRDIRVPLQGYNRQWSRSPGISAWQPLRWCISQPFI